MTIEARSLSLPPSAKRMRIEPPSPGARGGGGGGGGGGGAPIVAPIALYAAPAGAAAAAGTPSDAAALRPPSAPSAVLGILPDDPGFLLHAVPTRSPVAGLVTPKLVVELARSLLRSARGSEAGAAEEDAEDLLRLADSAHARASQPPVQPADSSGGGGGGDLLCAENAASVASPKAPRAPFDAEAAVLGELARFLQDLLALARAGARPTPG
jgi:hypothetical protein